MTPDTITVRRHWQGNSLVLSAQSFIVLDNGDRSLVPIKDWLHLHSLCFFGVNAGGASKIHT